MVKLSYVNRKSEGVKLGQIVAKDLRKRTKPQAASSKSDTHKDVSLLELNLEGKALTDEGIAEAAQGLEECLTAVDCALTTKLQILNLSGNGLTVKALSMLAPCIRASAQDLEDLDLSNNLVSVATDEDAHEWETFLRSFARSQALKRFSMTGNDLSGGKAMEVFCRVYLSQFDRAETRLDQYAGHDPDSAVDMPNLIEALQDVEIKQSSNAARTAPLECPPNNRICGLPRIENILMSNASMTDADALSLSYMLSRHLWAAEKLHGRLRLAADDIAAPGITYLPNDAISSIGLKILKLAKSVPYEWSESSEAPYGPENSPIGGDSQSLSQFRKMSACHQRKQSTILTATDSFLTRTSPGHVQQSAFDELESLRWKTQRAMLERSGPGSTQLWKAAFQMLVYTRRLLLDGDYKPTAALLQASEVPAQTQSRNHMPAFISNILMDNKDAQVPHCAIVGVSSEPNTPQGCRQPRRRRDSFSVGSDPSPPRTSGRTTSLIHTMPKPITMTDKDAKEHRMVGLLPINAWKIIIAVLSDPYGVLSEEQKREVFRYGMDRRKLATEAEILGKPDSVQMWRVLHEMRCLTCDHRV